MGPVKLVKICLSIVIMAASVSACATIEGAGKDIEKAGEAIQRTVQDVTD